MSAVPQGAGAVWDEWGRITRFLESARLAFARERTLWSSLELADPDQILLTAPTGQGDGSYRVSMKRHLEAVQDEETLFASVLVHSYALAESAAATRLNKDSRTLGGIEDWGGGLLATTAQSWQKVYGGRAGAVELAVVRNAFAHGTRAIDQASFNRLTSAGATSRESGSQVTLNYVEIHEYRARLRSLLRLGGVNPPAPPAHP